MSRPRQPKQARSRARFEAILDAADEVFLEMGFDDATTNHVAARAETSIGGLYRFFPDKEALLIGLAERYAARMLALGAEVTGVGEADTPAQAPPPPSARVAEGVERFATFLQDNPGFLTLMRQAHHPALAPGRRMMEAQMRGLMEQANAPFAERLSPAERAAVVAVSHQALSALQELAATAETPEARRAILEETKRMVGLYLQERLG